MSNWRKLMCKRNELQLLGTLNGGQSFRWKKSVLNDVEQWTGVFSNKVWILEQHEDHILYQVHEEQSEEPPQKKAKESNDENHEKLLKCYFQLDLNLEDHYKEWSASDAYFKEAAKQFYGIRILKQEVTENIFSFICSSNNHISRISSMVEKLATFYGNKICEIEGISYYSFPNVEDLATEEVEQKLRENGFGYRAKYISKSAQHIKDGGGQIWLENLQKMNYEDAKRNLMLLTGIGAKVADCICLMSLGHLQAIPVDTHIYQIAEKFYMPKLAKQKSLTEKIYNEIGDHFRNLYGPLAGWAHTVLFCADLKKFQVGNKATHEDKKEKAKKAKGSKKGT